MSGTTAVRSLARRYFEDLFNAGELGLADEILHPDISFLGPITPDGIHGIDAYKRFALGWYTGFPDRRFALVEEWVDANRIATVFHITGTHQGEFMGRAATGNTIDVTAMNFFRIASTSPRTRRCALGTAARGRKPFVSAGSTSVRGPRHVATRWTPEPWRMRRILILPSGY